MSISISHITKSYGRQRAVDDVSFETEKGQIAGFIGPNGAGKSTIMKIITGFIPPDSGDVWVNGLNVTEHPMEIKRITGYLPENNPLYPEMYVKEYLEYAASHYMGRIQADTAVSAIISKTGLERECHKKIGELSKGYRQRVGLAQALLHDPGILILDEPTSGLDPGQIIEIRNLISELGKEKTILLSTHIMQEVEAICDKVIIISNGKIVADEKTEVISTSFGNATDTIQVEFRDPLPAGQLEKLEGVIRVQHIKENIFLVETSHNKDLRGDIFDFAVKNNLTVLSMQRIEKSLEEVFREKVTGDK